MPRPPRGRAENNPWPQWPVIYRASAAHEEGGERVYAVSTKRFIGENGRVAALELVNVEMVLDNGRGTLKEIPGSEFMLKADVVLLAMGFVGPEKPGMLVQLGVKLTERGNVWRDTNWMTNVPGVFAAGDMQRGQSLIVWAVAEGRSAARGVDRYLMGASDLPAPL
jgi:glutamate synthase (NADPH/NADH) small chain